MLRSKIILSLFLLCTALSLYAREFTPSQFIFKTSTILDVKSDRTGLSGFDSFLSSLQAHNIRPIKGMHTPQYYLVDLVVEPDWEAMKAGAYRFDGIEYVQPNYLRQMHIEPNDPLYSRQLHSLVSLPQAWNLTTGSHVVIVGVVDSGVLAEHPDLAENIFINEGEIPDNGIDDDGNGYIDDWRGWDFVDAPELADIAIGDYMDPDNDPTDENFHGTHVAGIVGAVGNNGVGVSGVNWTVRLLPIRAGFRTTEGQGYLQDDDAAASIIYGADMGCAVINMSWGDPNYSAIIADACEYANNKGVTLVASAGNSPIPVLSYPARLSTVISVGSVNRARVLSGFSSYGVDLDLVAPGEMVLSTYKNLPNEYYIEQSGTSMSSPYVSGAVALLKSLRPDLSPDEVRARLLSSTDDLGPLGFDIRYGHGLLNVSKLLENTNPPYIAVTSPFEMQGISSGFDIIGCVNGEDFLRYSVMRSNKLSPAASDWRNVHNDTAEIHYYQNRVDSGLIARFNIPDHMPEGRYLIRIQYHNKLGQIYNKYLTVFYDNSAPVLRQNSLTGFKRYDRQALRYYGSAVFDENVRSYLSITASDGSLHYSYAATQDSMQVWALPASIPQGPISIQIHAFNSSGLSYVSPQYDNFLDIEYRVIPSYGFENSNVGNARVPFEGLYDFDGNGKQEYVAMNLPSSGYGRVYAYEPTNAGHIVKHDFEDDFRPLGMGNTNQSGMEILGLRADRAYLRETLASQIYPTTIVWADSSVSGGTMANFTTGSKGILMVKNLPTENVIQTYQRNSNGVMIAHNTLRNTTQTNLRNTFVPTIIVENFDDDAMPDILCADTDGDVMIYEVMNANAQQLSWTRRMPVANTYHLSSGDYTGDGKKEFIVGGYYTSIMNQDMNFWYFEGFKNTGNNSYSSMGSIMFNTVESQNAIHSADLTGDGTDEVILALSPNLYTIKYINGEWVPTFYGNSYSTFSIASWSDDTGNIRFLTNNRAAADSVYAAEWKRSAAYTGPPSPNLNLVEPQDESSVLLTWTDNGADTYRIYRKNADEQMILVAETPETSYLDTGLMESHSYSYAIATVDFDFSPSVSLPSQWQSVIPYRRPELESIVMVGSNELRLIFNQTLASDAINPTYYHVNGGMGSPSSVNLIHDHWGLQLRFAHNFSSENSPYTIEMRNLRGKTGVRALETEYSFAFVIDTEAPQLLDAIAQPGHQSVILRFSEVLSTLGVSDLANYKFSKPANDEDNAILSASLSGSTITLNLKTELKYSNQSYYLELFNLTDLAGNAISPQYNTARLELQEIRNLGKVKTFPNPIRANQHHWLTWINFPTGKSGKIGIFDSSGQLVYQSSIGPFSLATNNITWRWNLVNQHGLKVSSGIYYYVIEMDGMSKRGQIAVIK